MYFISSLKILSSANSTVDKFPCSISSYKAFWSSSTNLFWKLLAIISVKFFFSFPLIDYFLFFTSYLRALMLSSNYALTYIFLPTKKPMNKPSTTNMETPINLNYKLISNLVNTCGALSV